MKKKIKRDSIVVKRIINWWNSNGFMGFYVDDVKDITELLNEFPHYRTISYMIRYHQKQTELNTDYYQDIKDHLLVSPRFIDAQLEGL